jgi:urea transport system substrate-binding protein
MRTSSAAIVRLFVWALLVFRALFVTSAAGADENIIRVGILHSLSGTMAISESALKDTVLMLIEDQNRKGGLLGRKLVPVVVDPASDWDLFAEKARDLLTKEKVAVVFGCWTSASRKSVLPVFEQFNGLLYYPVQYEGEESSRNIFYTGAAPNQQAIPAAQYLMSKKGGEVRRWVLLGTDYVYPRTTDEMDKRFLHGRGDDCGDRRRSILLFGRAAGHSSVPATYLAAAARRGGQGWPHLRPP